MSGSVTLSKVRPCARSRLLRLRSAAHSVRREWSSAAVPWEASALPPAARLAARTGCSWVTREPATRTKKTKPLRRQACHSQAGARVELVAAVDADQQGRQRLQDPRRLQAAAVHRASAGKESNDLGRHLPGLGIAADEDVLVAGQLDGLQGAGHHRV